MKNAGGTLRHLVLFSMSRRIIIIKPMRFYDNKLLIFSFENNGTAKKDLQIFLHKSILGFRFWTFFLSIFEKGKYFCVKRIAIFRL